MLVRAAEFDVYSNAGERAARNVAEDLLLMRTVLGKIGHMNVSSRLPTRVFVFRDTRSFLTLADSLLGANAHKSGIFAARGDLRLIAIDASTLGARQIAYHELVHQYANATWRELPVWFNEGIAEFYSDFSVNGRTVHIGRSNGKHIRWLRRTRPIPMREFLLADAKTRWYTSTLDQQRFYAQAWAFVHYLMLMRETDLQRFLAMLQEKRPVDEAFAEVFRISYNEMNRQLTNYVRRPTLVALTFPIEELPIEPVPSAVPATTEEVQARIDEVLREQQTIAAAPQADEELARIRAEKKAERERRNREMEERYDELLKRYDEAVTLVGTGDYPEARKILDDIIPKLEELGTTELLEVAVDLRKQLPK